MKPLLAALLLSLSFPASAQSSLEGAATGSGLESVRVPAFKYKAGAAAKDESARRGRPPRRRIGSLEGTLNGERIELRWTEVHHRISGTVNGAEVDVQSRPDLKSIRGSAAGGEVALALLVEQNATRASGAVNGRKVEYAIDWNARSVRGELYGKPLKLDYDFDGMDWTLKGEAAGAAVELRQSPDTGVAKIRGSLQGADATVGIAHVTLADFLTHFFLLVK
jgi:hypothetical protein